MALVLTHDERTELEARLRSRKIRAEDARRARVILMLADGASFVACDVNTAITAGITGSAITTATHIDFLLSYVIEDA